MRLISLVRSVLRTLENSLIGDLLGVISLAATGYILFVAAGVMQ